jgi:hypothetical protein
MESDLGTESASLLSLAQGLRTSTTVAAFGAAMLSYAMWGHPPYWFFILLKTYVTLGSLYCAYALWKAAQATAPLGLLLLGVAAVNVFAKMRRTQWFAADLFACVLFISVVVIAPRLLGSRKVGTH